MTKIVAHLSELLKKSEPPVTNHHTNLEYLLGEALALRDFNTEVFEATSDNDFEYEWTVAERYKEDINCVQTPVEFVLPSAHHCHKEASPPVPLAWMSYQWGDTRPDDDQPGADTLEGWTAAPGFMTSTCLMIHYYTPGTTNTPNPMSIPDPTTM